MIPPEERRKMQAVSLCGPKVVERLEDIGISSLADLRGQQPLHLVERVNLSAGAPIWRHPRAVRAVANLVHAAEAEAAAEGPTGQPG